MSTGFLHTLSRPLVLAFLFACGAPTLVHPGDALAAPGSTKPAKPAKDPVVELFESANKLFVEQKYDAALLLFRKAYEQSQSPNAHLMIGKCLLALNRLPEAYDEFAATMREAAKRAETEPKYADTRDAAATELAPLEAKVGKVVITLVDAGTGLRVLLGGTELQNEKLGTPVAVVPGMVEIVVEGLAQGRATRREEIKGGETKAVVFGAPEPKSLSPKANITVPMTKQTVGAESGGGVRKAGFAVLGLGLVGMGLFAFGGLQGNARFATLEKECGTSRCTDPKYADLIESGKTFDLVANIGLGVGAAGLMAGTIMVVTGGVSKPKTTNAAVFVGPHQTMFTVKHIF